jgi:macrolide transport system ATP-binding/permease protein
MRLRLDRAPGQAEVIMSQFFTKLRLLVQRRRKEDDLRAELQFHLDEEAEQRQAEGSSDAEARLAARRDIGNLTLVQEETRAVWISTWVEQLVQDCRYGLRTIAANKTFSLLAIVSLALGIGANTAIFSFMDSLLLRSLPVSDPASLAVLNWRAPAGGARDSVIHRGSGNIWRDGPSLRMSGIFPYPAFELIRDSSGAIFSSVFAYRTALKLNVMVKGQAELGNGEFVSGDYFRGLAVSPSAGRLIIPDDDRVGAPPIAVLSYAYSQRRFGDPASAPGQSILINNVPFSVVGVAPPGFFGVDPAAVLDFYVPLRTNLLLRLRVGANDSKDYLDPNFYWLEIMARLRPGVSVSQAQAVLGPLFHQWVNATAIDRERGHLPQLLVREGATGLDTLRRQYSKPLYVLLALVALILAIACANIANLLLTRATARRREMAVRLSIGAGRLRLIRQLLTESMLLASIGGAVGVLFAMWEIRFLTFLMANGNEDFNLRPELNWSVLGAASALAVLTGILFGLAPALQSTRVDVVPALRGTRTGQTCGRYGWGRIGLSQALVATQIALSLLMLVAAGLFVRTLSNLQSIELGFNREDLLLFKMNARQAGHKDPEIITFYSELEKRLAAIPGVRSASALHHQMIGQGTWSGDAAPVGKQPKPGFATHILLTGPDFFSTMQIPVLLGRGFDDRDRPGSQATAVVSEAYVRSYFPDRNPLGQHITISRRPPLKDQDVEIVGVAANARYGALKGAYRDIVYLPFNQGSYYPLDEMTFALRTSGEPLRYVSTVREIVRHADSRLPVTDVNTQAAQIDQTMTQEIIFARLCTAFAVLALLIACVGLYGTMAYTVARRTTEIGIRMAIGAQRGAVVWMILREVFVLASVGVAIGVPAAIGASRLVESFLFEVKPNSPAALLFAVAVLVTAVLVAGYAPARRASRIDPMTAIRHE